MKLINPSECPPQNPSFSQASIATGRTVYLAGQIGMDPGTGTLAGDDVVAQTKQIFENVTCILAAAGSSLERVVKATIFITDLADWPEMNSVYAEYLSGHAPPKSTVEVSGLALGARVEIEFTAEA
ncbi:MAG: Rid family detoxifying hydrolase [Trueperaceae bacterium]